MPAHGTEYQNRLTVLDETPCGCEAKLPKIPGKWRGSLTDRRNAGGEKSRDKGSFVADTEVEARGVSVPHDLAVTQSCRPPLVLHHVARLVPPKPVGEVVKLIAVGQYRREANYTALSGVCPLQ